MPAWDFSGYSSNKKESYSTSNAFSSGYSGAKKTSTSTSTSTSFGGGDNNRETYRTKTQYTQYTPTQTKKAKAKVEADRKADNLKRLNEICSFSISSKSSLILSSAIDLAILFESLLSLNREIPFSTNDM